MGITVISRLPANGANAGYGSETMSISYGADADEIIWSHTYYWRLNGGAWQSTTAETKTVSMAPGYSVEWYCSLFYQDTGGSFHTLNQPVWTFYAPADTTDPTITSVTPATGNIAPGTTGVAFGATFADNYLLTNGKLYIDSELEQTWTSAGAKTFTKSLDLGAHTYEFTALDVSGNTATTGVINITVINSLPVVPSGTITVAGQTGAVMSPTWDTSPSVLARVPRR